MSRESLKRGWEGRYLYF